MHDLLMTIDGQHSVARRRGSGPDAAVRCRTSIGIARSTSLADICSARKASQ
jgi:hypothetical protein